MQLKQAGNLDSLEFTVIMQTTEEEDVEDVEDPAPAAAASPHTTSPTPPTFLLQVNPQQWLKLFKHLALQSCLTACSLHSAHLCVRLHLPRLSCSFLFSGEHHQYMLWRLLDECSVSTIFLFDKVLCALV